MNFLLNLSSARARLGAAALKGLENLDDRAPLVVAPANSYAGKLLCSAPGSPVSFICLFVKKMRRAGQTLVFGRLTALPMTLTRKPERRTSGQRFGQAHAKRSNGSFGHRLCDWVRPI